MHARRRGLRAAVLAAIAGVATLSLVLPTSPAFAADPPSPPIPLQRDAGVVTSDPLPTVQIDNGYVWSQATIGTTVYAGGGFQNARAPLANPGTSLTPRSNVLAFDITTGNLLPWAPQVDGVVRAVAASADGSRVYIGGSFSQVNGQGRSNFAALDAATGQLVPGFSATVGGSGVYGLAVTADTVYATGLFTQANGVARKNLAAFATANGALRAWAPTTDLQGDAIVVEPGGAHIVVGGRFSLVNGVAQRGLAAIHPTSGALDTGWLAPQTVRNGWGTGTNAGRAGIFGLAVDDSAVYGTGWVFANATVGNLEGTFAAEAGSGAIRWVTDCHGDHYGVYSTGEVVYTTSHTHACDTAGLHPEQNPRSYRYVEAWTASAEGILTRSPSVGTTYADWSGTPAPAPYIWYPDFTIGRTSGLNQAGLSITGAGDFIAIAGEFTSVNNRRFEGIVRFSTNPPGGPKDGPRLNGATWGAPSASSVVGGRARITVPINWDRDDRDLTYQLLRAGTAQPVAQQTLPSGWWMRTSVVFNDTGLAPGSTHTYTVRAVDGNGNVATSQPATVTIAAGASSAYADRVLDDGATVYYPLGSITADWAGGAVPQRGTGVTVRTPGAVAGITGETASTFNGTTNGRVSSAQQGPPSTFSAEVWFSTTTGSGGKLLGFGSAASGSSSSYDRHIYMRNDGRLVFGVYPGQVRTVASTAAYNDGRWHHAVATLGAGGMALYVDGALVGQDTATTSAQVYNGYWRVGGDNLGGWPSPPSSAWFQGGLDEVAVYPRALSSGEVMAHYAAGLGMQAPTAAFSATTADLTASFDGRASSAAGGATIASYAWSFGDGSTGSGPQPTHAYASPGTYQVTLTVTDSRGTTGAVTQPVAVTGPNAPPTASIGATASGLTVSVDSSGSSDPDGQIVSRQWSFGDGATATGTTASHRYAAAGSYTVTLTVTDDRGATATATRAVTVTHAAPTASFTASATGLQASVDASASSASDGATLSYRWDWGDGTPAGSGVGASHAYGAAGTYEIRLTVTDSLGATATTSREVSVSEQAFAARDDFERSVASGWGSAEVGGAYTMMGGSTTVSSVSGGVGRMTLSPGFTRNQALQGLRLADSSTTVDFTLTQAPITGNTYVGVAARQSSTDSYTARAWLRTDGSVWLVAQRGGTVLRSQALGVTWSSGAVMHLAVEVVGSSPTTIRAKVWRDGTPEPGWQLTTTDSTAALQGTGWVSLHGAHASSATGPATVAFDALRILDPSATAPAPNAPPTAALTATTSGLSVSVDGRGSSDSDGTIASHSWSWGDGSPNGSGATASHTYAAPGTYQVVLTVTDDDGATATAARQVVVTAPTQNAPPTAAFTATATGLSVAVDASGSSDADGSVVAYSWDWGDGTPASSGRTATHAYATAGTYVVTLTVTDDDGATGTTTRSVQATAGPAPQFAIADDFERTVASGWGTADVGGGWSMLSGTAAPLSVADGAGRMTLVPGSTRNAVLTGTPLRDARIVADVRLDQAPSTGGSYVGVLARANGADHYLVRAWLRDNGSVWLVVQRGGTVLQSAAVPGLVRAGGDSYRLEVEVTGSAATTIRARLSPTGAPEPATWHVTATDANGLPAGAVGAHASRGSSATSTGVFTIDALRVTQLG